MTNLTLVSSNGREHNHRTTMADFDSYIGASTGRGTLVVERAPITQFAKSLGDHAPEYRNADQARAAGFTDVLAPPTFGFSIQNWGKWEERQPAPDPDQRNPMAEVIGGLLANGGIVLHGEQSFTYHRPMVVGDIMNFQGTVTAVYQKPTGDRVMTFMVIDDVYTDAATGELVLTSTMNLLHRS